MVHELQAKYFVKERVLAMLNTLFPPSAQGLPDRIPPKVLHLFRNTFYRYLVSIETNGAHVLDGYVRKLQIPGNKYSWLNVRECVEDYINQTDKMIKSARDVVGIKYFRDQCSDGRASPHSEYLTTGTTADGIDVTRPSLPSRPPSSDKASIDVNLANTDCTLLSKPEISQANTNTTNSRQITASRPRTPYFVQGSQTERRDSWSYGDPSLEARRRVMQEHWRTASSNRPFTSDDMILPGTPLLPGTPEVGRHFPFNIPVNGPAEPTAINRTPELGQLRWLNRPYEALNPRPKATALKSKTSFSKFIRQKFTVGSSGTSPNLRGTLTSQNGLGISLGPSNSMENFPSFGPTAGASGRPVLRKQSSMGYLEQIRTGKDAFRPTSGSVSALEAMDSRSDALRSEAIEPANLANSQPPYQIKKKRSLPAMFARKKSSPPVKDSEPACFQKDDEYERYVLLSRLQPIQNKKLEKARSFSTLKSTADSQVTINSVVRRKKLQKLPNAKPSGSADPTTETPLSEPLPNKLQVPLEYNWDPNSEEWKSREYTRRYYLEKHRTKKFNLNDPEGGPIRGVRNEESQSFECPRAAPKRPLRQNAQRSGSIFPSRHTPKTPIQKKYTVIDVNKYAKL
jgi:hypothetical protein